jgi:hypothetical protein
MKRDSKYIRVTIDGKEMTVTRKSYAAAKAKQLREFGYNGLTTEDVTEQIDALLAGNKLTVIGMFLKDEVIVG